MATKSLATKSKSGDGSGSDSSLWLGCGAVCMDVHLDRDFSAAPPHPDQVDTLNETIIGLGLAVADIASQLKSEDEIDPWRTGLALEALADAIVLHATLSNAVTTELHREDAAALAAAA